MRHTTQTLLQRDSYSGLKHINFDWRRSGSTLDRQPVGFDIKKNVKPSIFLSFNGIEYKFNADFQEIVDEINFSKSYLEYEVGWDGQDAAIADKDVYLLSVNWLIKQLQFVYTNYRIVTSGLEINLCPDGSIDFSWVNKKARLLINFRKSNDGFDARYYGIYKRNNDNIDQKGTVDLQSEVDESLALWMKHLT